MEPIKPPAQPQVPRPPEQPVQTPPTPSEPRPTFSPESDTQHKIHTKKGLAIMLVVAFVLLLAGLGVGGWLVWQKVQSGSQPPTVVFNADDVTGVSSVTFVPPEALPTGYVRRDENTYTEQSTLYSEVYTNCAIATRVSPLNGITAKEAVLKQAGSTAGITTTSNADGTGLKIADIDGKHEYKFSALDLEQSVNVVGVGYNKQFVTILYKPFNAQVASVTISCRVDTWDGQKAALLEAAKQFKVKSER